jgi:glycosyltransferase involved in cell wall biosynthesis
MTTGVRFTVVIPAFNEAALLGRTLESLHRQDFAGAVEIIVVDNNSTDETASIASSYGAIVLFEPQAGVCWARQRGTSVATGEIVLSTDADTVHPTGWLSRIDAQFRASERCVAVAGPCRFTPAPMWARTYPSLLFGMVYLIYALTGRIVYASATNIAFRRSAFTGYDTTLTQGGDELGLLRRLRGRGPMVFDRSNVVTTSARRLQRGLLYNLFVTLIFYYVVTYVVNSAASRTILGTAPAFRQEAPPRHRLGFAIGGSVTVCCLVIWVV